MLERINPTSTQAWFVLKKHFEEEMNRKQMKDLFASVEVDASKFYNSGNSAAGTRVRKGMQDLKNLAQAIRNEVTEKKNSGK